ncbi:MULTISPECIES: SMP-30/gluconolactonase/LRE family protein [unclassified Streptomyces]|uniref:SMP-30/gluconolactonase/LRE family protein n=1 Tax=unclassified Streptomyces TaxID=2593676 RepID=UPI00225C3516|nr:MULTISPECIES: SMP-30/gluconolactonase/LRE family protein [unclassified Streptomyces]MCX4527846.1 SMP-30/gluconolactonase/LRE family protein [Streptomyces sp. NBC_01551]MCX4541557.1 SMP-30/gluconolactonase/LRE family protein [Streptomyces sp. NBC_01565]
MSMRPRLITLALTTLAVTATTLTLGSTTAGASPSPRVSTAFTIPGEKVYPEGIAADPRTGTVYVGSYADGTVYRARPGARKAEVFLPAGTDGRDTANGLRVDARGRLWVTDSTTGVAVYDARTGTRLAHFEVEGGGPFFVNDLAITPDGTAYLTDSVRAVVYRVTPAQLAAGSGALLPAFDLSGHLAPRPAGTFNLNGIVADRSGRYLLTVDMTAGDLHRLDLRTGAITRVALTGGDLKAADGLDLSPDGTLRVAHNTSNTLTRWQVSPDGTRARLTRTITDPGLQIPTTLAHIPGRTLVVRSQFDKDGPLTPSTGTPTTFTIAAVQGL